MKQAGLLLLAYLASLHYVHQVMVSVTVTWFATSNQCSTALSSLYCIFSSDRFLLCKIPFRPGTRIVSCCYLRECGCDNVSPPSSIFLRRICTTFARSQLKFHWNCIYITGSFLLYSLEAASYDGSTTNSVWISSEYSGSGTDWSTFIGETHF